MIGVTQATTRTSIVAARPRTSSGRADRAVVIAERQKTGAVSVIAVAIVLLAGTATALAGPIAFVGLVVPHVVRALVGPDHRRLLPFSMLGGAVLVVVADTVGRIVLPPAEVQVGIMAAVVGVPVFIALIRRTGRAL